MSCEERAIKNLLDVDGEAGLVRFAGRVAVVLEASALGLLRKELVAQAGLEAARALLTRVGFAHGWRLAHARGAAFAPLLLGLCRREAGMAAFLDDAAHGERSLHLDSHEAELHLAHLGPSRIPACWVLCGLASGYLSHALGRDMEVREDRCVAMGDARCHFEGRPREAWGPAPAAPPGEDPCGLMAHSAVMRRLVDLARRIAPAMATVLITGESGTGKERLARLVHRASRRASGPFLAVNCGAIAEPLLESELFGHARGAFTGAVCERQGLFEAAGGGTLLLDEVGELPASMQVKLLRVLQEREVRRVGENSPRAIDVRILAATNTDLDAALRDGTFRRDLYYRLNVVGLHVPALRERPEDILPLARGLLAEAARRLGSPALRLSPEVEERLLRHAWPGNVRELENAMERAAALADQAVVTALPGEARPPGSAPVLAGPARTLADVEKDHILAVLEANGGNQAHTAADLGIGSATLYRKLKAYGLVRTRWPRLTPRVPAPARNLSG